MEIIKVRDPEGVVMATLYPVPPQADGQGWLSVVLMRQGMSYEEAFELYTKLGQALTICRGDIRPALVGQAGVPDADQPSRRGLPRSVHDDRVDRVL